MKDIVDKICGTQHHFSSRVYAKQMKLPAGFVAVSHKHTYDHLSILASGIVTVTVGGESVLYAAPACLTIAAGEEHKIFAHTDATWFCIHATEETDVDKIDDVAIQKSCGEIPHGII